MRGKTTKKVKKPTDDSLNSFGDCFFAGFIRVTGTEVGKAERSEVYKWVRTTLTAEGVLVYVKKDKENFTKRDLDRVLDAIWNADGLASIPERYRWAPFFNGGLRYGGMYVDVKKDINLALQRVDKDTWRPIYQIKQRWVKNNWHPGAVHFDAPRKDHAKSIHNRAGISLTLAIADNALSSFESLDDLRKQRIPPDEPL